MQNSQPIWLYTHFYAALGRNIKGSTVGLVVISTYTLVLCSLFKFLNRKKINYKALIEFQPIPYCCMYFNPKL